MAMPNQSQAMPRRLWVRCSMKLVYREFSLFGVQHSLEKQDADGRENDVVTG